MFLCTSIHHVTIYATGESFIFRSTGVFDLFNILHLIDLSVTSPLPSLKIIIYSYLFSSMLCVIVHLHFVSQYKKNEKIEPLWTSIIIRIHSHTFVSSHIYKYKGLTSCAHAITVPSPCFTDEVVYFAWWIMSSLFLSPSSLPIILVEVDRYRSQIGCCFITIQASYEDEIHSDLPDLEVYQYLNLVINPVYLLKWCLLLFADTVTTSWSVSLI